MGHSRTGAFEPISHRPHRTFKRRLRLFAQDWFPVLASLALVSLILVMIYDLVS